MKTYTNTIEIQQNISEHPDECQRSYKYQQNLCTPLYKYQAKCAAHERQPGKRIHVSYLQQQVTEFSGDMLCRVGATVSPSMKRCDLQMPSKGM